MKQCNRQLLRFNMRNLLCDLPKKCPKFTLLLNPTIVLAYRNLCNSKIENILKTNVSNSIKIHSTHSLPAGTK